MGYENIKEVEKDEGKLYLDEDLRKEDPGFGMYTGGDGIY